MLVAGQAQQAQAVPVSSYVSKCSGGKCPPIIETLKAQGDANKEANEAFRKKANERGGYIKATRLGQPNNKDPALGDLNQNLKESRLFGKIDLRFLGTDRYVCR